MVLREAKYYGGRNRDNHMTIKASFHFTSNSKWCSFWNFFQDLPSSKSPPMFYPTWRLKPFSPEAQVSSGQWTSEAQSRTGACTLAQLEYVGIPFRQGSRMIWWYLCLYILVYIYIYNHPEVHRIWDVSCICPFSWGFVETFIFYRNLLNLRNREPQSQDAKRHLRNALR